MFNYVNGNPDKDEERKYLEEDDNDEVSIAQRPILTEDEVLYLTKEYIAKLKSEHENEPKVLQKLDKFMAKFDVKKFMKSNPNMTVSDFNMVMYNETAGLLS